jgi:hypothetical protein
VWGEDIFLVHEKPGGTFRVCFVCRNVGESFEVGASSVERNTERKLLVIRNPELCQGNFRLKI